MQSSTLRFYQSEAAFLLESGDTLPSVTIAYHTYGALNAQGDNVVWVCHALTANSNCADWWKGLVGDGALINPEEYFIVCANIIGSCYGSLGPVTVNQETGKPYYGDFPLVTIRDMVKAHQLLCKHLGIRQIALLMGGSMGGYQALEWTVMEPELIKKLFLIATSPAESAWGIAIHTAQRLAIEADASWQLLQADAGAKGLKAARAIGMLTYRNYAIFQQTQLDPDVEKTDGYRASSYILYQGDKLVNRFNAYAYWLLTKAMDSHQLARGRAERIETVLQSIQQPVLIIGISSDILCPVAEQELMAKHMPHAEMVVIDSKYGHDGFIIETDQITEHLRAWLSAIK